MFSSFSEGLSSWWSKKEEKEEGEGEGEGEKREAEEEGEKEENQETGWTKGIDVATGLFQSVSGYAVSITENVKKQVTEKTSTSFIGEFQKEQDKFVRNQQRLKDASVPPWDSRNVLREPPPEVNFTFEYSRIAPVAMVMLKEDPRLQKLRFELVPKKVSEEIFWRNYFYRVSLAKQSVQLSTLSSANSKTSIEEREQPQAEERRGEGGEGEGGKKKEEVDSPTKVTASETDEQVDEFISDHPYNIDPEAVTKETLKKELSQLGVEPVEGEEGGGGGGGIDDGELWDELQAELKDLDLEEDNDDGLLVDWEEEMKEMMNND
uniref:BSD domain-containing protein n=2 Tax=Amphimedon queenslandica TaxID=400682 RepID=A0A1X7TJ89_AMPQE